MKLKLAGIIAIFLIFSCKKFDKESSETVSEEIISAEIHHEMIYRFTDPTSMVITPLNKRIPQIKFEGEEQYKPMYREIEGFSYEEGFTYKIELKMTVRDPNPKIADDTVIRYQLLKIKDKAIKAPRKPLKVLLSKETTSCNVDGEEINECVLRKFEGDDEYSLDFLILWDLRTLPPPTEILVRKNTETKKLDGKDVETYDIVDVLSQ